MVDIDPGGGRWRFRCVAPNKGFQHWGEAKVIVAASESDLANFRCQRCDKIPDQVCLWCNISGMVEAKDPLGATRTTDALQNSTTDTGVNDNITNLELNIGEEKQFGFLMRPLKKLYSLWGGTNIR